MRAVDLIGTCDQPHTTQDEAGQVLSVAVSGHLSSDVLALLRYLYADTIAHTGVLCWAS
jgi:hypothetical protein